MAYTTSQKHAEHRRRIEEERAERRRLEEEEQRRRSQKKRSASIPAKWYWDTGVRIGGTPVCRFIYAGANMSSMVAPTIPEPSLLNPVEPIAESAADAEPLGAYPLYQMMSPEQRRGYIDFLASDRSETCDIGYVFLYLYGLERRLLLDARKPGEVSEEEHRSLIDEILRIDRCFGQSSESLSHYIAMLLLYDGTIFDIMDERQVREFLDIASDVSRNKNRLRCENADSMSYLIASRFAARGYTLDSRDLLSAARGRFLRSSNAAMLGISKDELYEPALMALVSERLRHVDLSRSSRSQARSIGSPSLPMYFPASPMLRKRRSFEIDSTVADDPETLGVPLKTVSDLILKAKKDLDDSRKVLSSASLRDIESVPIDALAIEGPQSSPLKKFLDGRHGAIYVPVEVLDKELKQRFGTSVQYTSKGILSLSTQQLVSSVAASLGWQAMLPDVVEGAVTSFWRIDKSSRIVMFERRIAYKKSDGRRCIAPIFGGDESTWRINIPGGWRTATALAYIYAWFLSRDQEHFSNADLSKFLSKYYPPFSSQSGNKKNQVFFFFSILHATYSLKLSTHGIKRCLDMSDPTAVQELVFALCDEKFGNMLPPKVLEALEDIYKKMGLDPMKVLYDYHAGSYHYTQQEDIGFFIDADKFAATMEDTIGVQELLNDAMESAEIDELESGGAETGSEDPVVSSETDDDTGSASIADSFSVEGSEQTDGGDEPATALALEAVKELFGGTDEARTEDLLSMLVSSGFASTTAEAMGVIAGINDTVGEEIVEIDGTDAYLNI